MTQRLAIRVQWVVSCLLLSVPPVWADKAEKVHGTTVSSDQLELLLGEESNTLIFSGQVVIRSQDLVIHTDLLTIFLDRVAAQGEDFGPTGAIRRMEARGNVSIQQAGRLATCGRATILPDEGLVILEDNPEIVDGPNRLRGYRILFHQEDRRVEIQPGPGGERPEVTIEDPQMNP